MIKMLRIDERLIHGQVAVVWSRILDITHIILINQEVMDSPIQQSALKMAVPAEIKLAMRDIEGGILLLKDRRVETCRVMVVVGNPKDALVIAEHIQGIERINIGNYGLFPSKTGLKKQELASCVKADSEDLKHFKKIAELGVSYDAQLTPEKPKKDMIKLLKGVQ